MGIGTRGSRRQTARRRGVALVAVAMAVLAVSACSSDDGGSVKDPGAVSAGSSSTPATDSTSPAPAAPDCATVWVDGAVLPRPYRGCLDGNKLVEAQAIYCSQGSKLVTYGRSFYAVPGKKVNEVTVPLARDKTFKQALASCTA